MTVVAVKAGVTSEPGNKSSFESGAPQPLFELHSSLYGRASVFEYDVTADGKRFLLDAEAAGSASGPVLTVVVNWDPGLKK
jgi:hypothetical protein